MKYKTYASKVLKAHKGIFMHQMVSDEMGNLIPIMVIPDRLISALVTEFLVSEPRGDIGSWFGYVLHACVPDATELTQLYEDEHGQEACSRWIGDMFDKILLVNPSLTYEIVAVFQEPVQNDKVVYANFGKRARAHLW